MNKTKIKNLIKKGESQSLEFKLNLENTGKSICSFANTNNGIILVGVDDKRNIIGTKKKFEREIANIAHTCKPSIYPEIKEAKINNKIILIIKVKKSSNLHSYKNIAYKRVGSHDNPLNPEEVIEFAKSAGKIRFDEQVCENANLSDINEENLKLFLNEAKRQRGLDISEDAPVKEALMRLKLLKNGKVTNAAVLLFGKNPQDFFIQSEVKCIRFKGNSVTKPMIDLKAVKGNVINQLKKVEGFVYEHIPMAAWIEEQKLQRQEKWLYPPKAIREALANALAHRDYESASKVQVRIFDDRIEFWNPGKLPEGWTVETLKQRHDSIPRNPSIAKIFFFIKYIEEVGTGTNKILEWCVDWGMPEPEFECTETSLVLTFWQSKLTDKYLEELGLNERQKKVAAYVDEQSRINTQEYTKLCSCSERTALLDLTDLVDKHVMIRKGKGRATYYTFKYIRIPQKSRKSRNKKAENEQKEC